MPLLIGDHYRIDLVIQNGQIVFYTALQSFSYNDGSLNYHRFIPTFNLDKSVKKLVEDVLSGYTGLANIEIISNIIIDFHLRLNGDYYLYGDEFLSSIINLLKYNKWEQPRIKYRDLTLVPIFVPKNFNIKKININIIVKILDTYKCNSLRIDNIEGKSQGDNKSRLFMFDCCNFSMAVECKKKIVTYLSNL